jgi:hypothetical protein
MNPRELWRVIEPFHQLAYRSPEAVEGMTAIGLDRGDLQYFGARLAALGPVSAPVAVAVLFGFEPGYVAAAIPEAWQRAAPETIVAARLDAADATLRRVLGVDVETEDIARAAVLGRRAAEACDVAGRPLAAAHLALEWPDRAHLQLWHACTILREHRGDAHWVATSAAGLDAVECHVLHGADGHMPSDMLQRVTAWGDAAWAAAATRLTERGLLDGSGVITAAGRSLKLSLEQATDRMAAVPGRVLSSDEQQTLRDAIAPLVGRILDAGVASAWKLREELWRDMPVDPLLCT